jgi:alpha-1,3-rhamnosyl/mannosyltransferase
MRVIVEDGLQTIACPTGIGWYSDRLHKALMQHMGNVPASTDISVTFNGHPFIASCRGRSIRRMLYLGWINSVAEPMFRSKGADVVHFTANYTGLLKLSKLRLVFTIHDLTPWKAPHTLPKKLLSTPKLVLSHAIHKADVIITPTFTVKNEILELFPGVHHEKVVPCHHGIETIIVPASPETQSDNNKCFLFVGTLEKRKNVASLVRAFARLVKKRKLSNCKLLLIGKPGYGFDEIQQAIQTESVADFVLTTGYVEPNRLAQLYASARALVMPSLYEGFGIPLIEAMAYGVPVIASDIPVFREVAEDAALYYGQPTDVNGLTDALDKILGDDALRTQLIEKGGRRVRNFTLRRMAEGHINAYLKAWQNS